MKLKDYLIAHEIAIKDFAEKLDYTRSHISQIVNEKQKPSEKLKRQITKITKGEVTFD